MSERIWGALRNVLYKSTYATTTTTTTTTTISWEERHWNELFLSDGTYYVDSINEHRCVLCVCWWRSCWKRRPFRCSSSRWTHQSSSSHWRNVSNKNLPRSRHWDKTSQTRKISWRPPPRHTRTYVNLQTQNCVYLFVCLSVCLFVCLFVCLSVRLLARLFVCLFVSSFVCSIVWSSRRTRTYVNTHTHTAVFVCLFVCLSVCSLARLFVRCLRPRRCQRRRYVFCCISAVFVCPFVLSSGQILLPRYLMNGLSNLDETYSEYSIAPTDDLIKF